VFRLKTSLRFSLLKVYRNHFIGLFLPLILLSTNTIALQPFIARMRAPGVHNVAISSPSNMSQLLLRAMPIMANVTNPNTGEPQTNGGFSCLPLI
jgi:hypothetical protein